MRIYPLMVITVQENRPKNTETVPSKQLTATDDDDDDDKSSFKNFSALLQRISEVRRKVN